MAIHTAYIRISYRSTLVGYAYIYIYVELRLNLSCGVAQAWWMPPWLGELIRLTWWGSQSGWWGLSCPAHCSSSWILFLSVFSAGFGFGALAVISFLWISAHPLPSPLAPTPPASGPRFNRLAAYVHERR